MFKDVQQRLNASESYVSLALGLAVVLVVGSLVFNTLSKKTAGQPEAPKEVAENTETNTPGGTYKVQAGDTLWKIAEKLYNNGYNWVDIKKANPTIPDSNAVIVGQELVIPQLTTTTTPTPTVQQGQISAASTEKTAEETPKEVAAPNTTYTVVRGDTLWAISVRTYNNGYRWVDIARANHLTHPNLIHAGNKLVLP